MSNIIKYDSFISVGIAYAQNKHNAIIQAANEAKTFGYSVNSNFKFIRLYIRFIRQYDEVILSILTKKCQSKPKWWL